MVVVQGVRHEQCCEAHASSLSSICQRLGDRIEMQWKNGGSGRGGAGGAAGSKIFHFFFFFSSSIMSQASAASLAPVSRDICPGSGDACLSPQDLV